MAMDGMIYKFMLRQWGTAAMNQMSPEWGDSPVKNWKGSTKDWNMGVNADPDMIKRRDREIPLPFLPAWGGHLFVSGQYKESHKRVRVSLALADCA